MNFKLILILLFCFSAKAQAPATGFLDGVQAYQAKEYEKAQSQFTALLEESPENPSLLFNLGLTEYQLGNYGLALGLWRKTQSLKPDYKAAASAIEFTEEQLFPDKGSPSGFLSILGWLTALPLSFWLGLCLASFFFIGWKAIDYGAKRKKPFLEWSPWWFAMIPLFLLSLTTSSYLLWKTFQIKGTVIEKNRLAHASPSASSPTLSELQEGQVVLIEKSFQGWVQIRTLQGAPGWVPQKSIIVFGGI